MRMYSDVLAGRWGALDGEGGGGLRPLLLITADINVSATTVDNSIVYIYYITLLNS